MLGKALQRFGMGESAAAVAATVASMAGEGTLLGGMMAGVGDIAAQGYNIHAGYQTSINWKQTAKSTLSGGAAGFVTGGAFGMFSLTSAGQSFGKWMSEPTKLDLKAAEMMKNFWGDNRGSVGFGGYGDNSENIIQYEKLKSQYAANEVYNAERIGSALQDDPYHRSASYLSKEQLGEGRTYSYTGGDNRSYTLLQTKGELNGAKGIFEYIINDAGQVTHQRFIEGGIYTGVPNQSVPKGGY